MTIENSDYINGSEIHAPYRWWMGVRDKTLDRVPLESDMSYPVPCIPCEIPCMSCFYFGVRRKGGIDNCAVTTPIAKLTANYPDGDILSFLHKSEADIFPNMPMDLELGRMYETTLTPKERKNYMKILFNIYSPIITAYFYNQPISTEERKLFQIIFNKNIETPLQPYYQAMNPSFFSWLSSNIE